MSATMTYTIAMACARDAGNRAMRAAGRKFWSRTDCNRAYAVLRQLLRSAA